MANRFIELYYYNEQEFKTQTFDSVNDLLQFDKTGFISWINVCGLSKEEIHKICQAFSVNELLEEDIVSGNQRPKLDAYENLIFVLLFQFELYSRKIAKNQVSLILLENTVISVLADCAQAKNTFNRVKKALELPQSRIRKFKADFLLYNLLDNIVDDYTTLLEGLGDTIEEEEGHLDYSSKAYDSTEINALRHALLRLRKNMLPVREIIGFFLKDDHKLLNKKHLSYYKDINDHINQITDSIHFYHESITTLQDLYMNKINLKMNESMNVMAIVTCLLAPTTVLAGIFGMNFKYLPFLNDRYSFYILIAVLLVLSIIMAIYFKKKKWF